MTVPEVEIGDLAHPEPGSFKIGPFGSSLKKDELADAGIPVVGIENVLAKKFTPPFRRFITDEKYQQLSQYSVKPGDLLVTTMGTIGRAAVVPQNVNTMIIDSHLFRMRVDQSKVYPPYLCYALNGYSGLRLQLERKSHGAIMAGLNTTILKECTLPLPPLPEQQRIAAILAKADRLRRLRRTARELSDTYLQSVFLEMFGDPVSNARGWETLDFGKAISIISGHGFKKAEYSNDGVRLFQIANVSFQETLWDTLAYLPLDYIERYPKLVLKPGDLLMALNRPILGRRVKFAILKQEDCPAILYQRVGKFVFKSKQLHRDYLFGFMLTDYFYRELKVRLAGSDQPYINPTELVKMRFVLPPLLLQQQFAHIVHKFERLRAQQREAERQAEHLFQALLHRAFTRAALWGEI